MPILNLSKEQYNTFLNSNSLDDFINLRNSIEVNDELISIPKNYIAVRTLSLTELNKYLKTSTLDGSIVANNANVWHYEVLPGKAYWNSDYGSYGGRKWNSTISSFNNAIHARTTNIYINDEMVCNNSKNIIVIYRFTNTTYDAVAVSNGGDAYRKVSITTDLNTLISKNTNISSAKSITSYADYPAGSSYCYINIYAKSCFRPVFQFVDNNKSTNIHY